MWNRKELKTKGKAAFQANYWRSVFAALVMILFAVGTGAVTGRHGVNVNVNELSAGQDVNIKIGGLASDIADTVSHFSIGEILALVSMVLGIMFLAFLAAIAIDAFVINPLEVGCHRFFLVNSDSAAPLGELGYGFKSNYINIVKTVLLRDVFLFLWALLLVIPALVKSYSYRLVPYILADDPNTPAKEAITRSRELMNGNKWNVFVLDLSFLGWNFISALTLGLVGVFYSNPYQFATDAELYKAIKNGGSREAVPAAELPEI